MVKQFNYSKVVKANGSTSIENSTRKVLVINENDDYIQGLDENHLIENGLTLDDAIRSMPIDFQIGEPTFKKNVATSPKWYEVYKAAYRTFRKKNITKMQSI